MQRRLLRAGGRGELARLDGLFKVEFRLLQLAQVGAIVLHHIVVPRKLGCAAGNRTGIGLEAGVDVFVPLEVPRAGKRL